MIIYTESYLTSRTRAEKNHVIEHHDTDFLKQFRPSTQTCKYVQSIVPWWRLVGRTLVSQSDFINKIIISLGLTTLRYLHTFVDTNRAVVYIIGIEISTFL